MPKGGSDADNRIFFDQLVSLAASRRRATGVIRLEDRHAVIPFGEQTKLIGVAHTEFPNGGSWSYFVCPKCGTRSKKLWLVDDAPALQALSRKARSALSRGLRLRPNRAPARARSPCRQTSGHARRRPDALQTCAAKLATDASIDATSLPQRCRDAVSPLASP
jgi:hypothetical protein